LTAHDGWIRPVHCGGECWSIIGAITTDYVLSGKLCPLSTILPGYAVEDAGRRAQAGMNEVPWILRNLKAV